jgi:hypothetical protein
VSAISKASLLERESRFAIPAGLATLVAVALSLGVPIATPISGDGAAEVLRSVHEHASATVNLAILQGLAFLLLLPGLLYLFAAARARSDQVRGQLIGVVIAAPIFLCIFAILGGFASRDAASDFVAGSVEVELTRQEATGDCQTERADQGVDSFREEYGIGPAHRGALRECVRTERADDTAEDAIREASLRPVTEGFGFAGRLGLAAALLYTCLSAMRVGLLTRFWGSLGMALGVFAGLFTLQFVLVWFVYLGLLLLGWIPGGRPPAWAAGEAIRWPVPGERSDEERPEAAGSAPATAEEVTEPAGEEEADHDRPGHPTSKKRKRKRRR